MLGIKFASELFFPLLHVEKKFLLIIEVNPIFGPIKKTVLHLWLVKHTWLKEKGVISLSTFQSGKNTIQCKFIFSNKVMLLNVRDVGNPEPNFLLSPLSNFVLEKEN